METKFIHQHVKLMRPSSFSERERELYEAEKKLMRQFLLMKQQDQVPADIDMMNMKAWLRAGRRFRDEFAEIAETAVPTLLSELAWTLARRHCLNHMEQELWEELEKEKQLSLQFGRKVTLEGLQMLRSVVHPAAEEIVEAVLLTFFDRLLRSAAAYFNGHCSVSSLMEMLQQRVGSLVAEVVRIALDFLLEGADESSQAESAAEITNLLANMAAPCLSEFGHFPSTLLRFMLKCEAQTVVELVRGSFVERMRTFELLDFEESLYPTSEALVSAIQRREHRIRTPASSRLHPQIDTCEVLEEAEEFSEDDSEPNAEKLLQQTEDSAGLVHDQDTMSEKASLLSVETSVDELEDPQQNTAKDSEGEESVLQVSDCDVTVHIVSEDAVMEEMTQTSGCHGDETAEVCRMEPVESHDGNKKKKKKKGVRAFFSRIWRRMKRFSCVSTEERN